MIAHYADSWYVRVTLLYIDVLHTQTWHSACWELWPNWHNIQNTHIKSNVCVSEINSMGLKQIPAACNVYWNDGFITYFNFGSNDYIFERGKHVVWYRIGETYKMPKGIHYWNCRVFFVSSNQLSNYKTGRNCKIKGLDQTPLNYWDVMVLIAICHTVIPDLLLFRLVCACFCFTFYSISRWSELFEKNNSCYSVRSPDTGDMRAASGSCWC